MRNKWLVQTVPAGEQWPFPSKAAADAFCKSWVQEHASSELVLFSRPGLRPTARYRAEDGQAVTERLHHRIPSAEPARKPRCAAEEIDSALVKLGLPARDAVRARQALVETWKEGLRKEGMVWTPAGALIIVNAPQVKRARNSSLIERLKENDRKVRIALKPNPKYFPEPKTTEYTYKQFGYAKQMGLIEPSLRPEPLPLMARVTRVGKTKRMPPPRPRR